MNNEKKLIFSGIQPTGNSFTLGNYIGAVRNWGTLQNDYNCVYSIVDLHSITVKQVPAELRKNSLSAYALLIACGIDPQRSVVFFQSHNKCHAELSWVLSCYTQFGELSRMTQFKDKSAKHADNVNAGLFTYPVLMAADILAYNADLVPIGVDQKQHLELARNIAQRFNHTHGEFFTVPEAYIPKVGQKIKSLTDPTKKMSKSDENQNGSVYVLDDKDTVIRKFKKAVTDSGSEVKYADGKDGINNLITIYSVITGKSIQETEREFDGKGYGEFKLAVGETVADHLAPIREKHSSLMADKQYLKECYTEGAARAMSITQKTLTKVYRKVGFVDAR